MEIKTEFLELKTRGNTEMIDLTDRVRDLLSESGLREGSITVFAIGSTAGIASVEFEPGLTRTDLPRLFDMLAPYGQHYAHHSTWGDDNGSSHVRATMLGCSFVVPFTEGKLLLGNWQQIAYIDFDTRPRSRKVVVQLIGAK